MNNRKKQTTVVTMATVLSVTAIASPLPVMAQEDNPAPPAITQEQNIQQKTAPDISLPENLQATEGTALKEVVLPDNWSWTDDSKLITAGTTEYPARFSVDDMAYDYSNVEGYRAEGGYVECMVALTVQPAKQEQAELVKGKVHTLLGNILSVYNAGDIAINADNFPDEAFRTWLGQQDYGKDGTITQDEIASITSIDIGSNTNIKNLTGIEHFMALTELNCSGTGIKSLDVSKNTALDYLDCDNTGIKSLDNSKNKALEFLSCSSTGITSLDVSKNTALKFLYCFDTGIKSLDVSKNTALELLYCPNTGITGVDVSKNTNLTSLYCTNTGIKSLDVSKNTALELLDCSNTGITGVDVSKNTNLTSLYCYNTSLAYLNIGINNKLDVDKDNLKPVNVKVTDNTFNMADKFTGIDVSKITNVKGADYNSTTGVMSNYRAETPITYTYDCGTSAGGTKQTIDVTLQLEGYINPIEINADNFPDPIFRQYVSDNFDTSNPKDGKLTASEISNITTINVIGMDVKDITGIKYFTNLKELYCRETGISKLDISQNTALTSLDCSKTNISTLDVSVHSNLKYLTCNDTKITALDVSENPKLYQLMCYNTEIKELKLDKNPALTILQCYKTKIKNLNIDNNKNLETLMCSDTKIDKLIVTANTKLKYLDCANTNIQELVLDKNTDLSTLQCRNTKITSLDVGKCKVLNSLDCSSTQISKLDVSRNDNLLNLDCSNNSNLTSLNVDGATNLGYFFCFDTGITTLDVSNNKNLIYLVAKNKSLAVLNIGNNANLEIVQKIDSYINVNITGNTFNIKDMFKGIDTKKITFADSNVSFDRDTGIVTLMKANKSIVYTYDCGTSKKGVEVLQVTLNLNIEKKASSITVNQDLNKTYDGKSIENPTVDKTGSTGTVTFTYEVKKGDTWETCNDMPTNAGTYRVVAHLAEDDFFNSAETKKEFTISQADSSIFVTDDLNKPYDGNAVSATPALSKTGSTGAISFKWEQKNGNNWDVINSTPTAAGTYRVTATLASDSNYKGATSAPMEFTISKAVNRWTDTLSITGWTYGEIANEPTAIATFGKASYLYSNSENGTYMDTVPTNAGTWYVKAVVEGTDNYERLESDAVSFVIAPNDVTSNSQITIPDITANTNLDELVIKDENKILIQGTDYDVTKTQDGNKVTVVITFKGNYTGTITKTYTVEEKTPSSGDKTGDNSKTGLLATMSLLSAGFIAFLTGKKRKKRI